MSRWVTLPVADWRPVEVGVGPSLREADPLAGPRSRAGWRAAASGRVGDSLLARYGVWR
jgi:hypothetical protein